MKMQYVFGNQIFNSKYLPEMSAGHEMNEGRLLYLTDLAHSWHVLRLLTIGGETRYMGSML